MLVTLATLHALRPPLNVVAQVSIEFMSVTRATFHALRSPLNSKVEKVLVTLLTFHALRSLICKPDTGSMAAR